MAELVKGIRDITQVVHKSLECAICLDILVQPYSTQCNHQFCRKCLDQLLTRKKRKSDVQCPLCKAKITQRGLTENLKLGEIVNAVKNVLDAIDEDFSSWKAEKENINLSGVTSEDKNKIQDTTTKKHKGEDSCSLDAENGALESKLVGKNRNRQARRLRPNDTRNEHFHDSETEKLLDTLETASLGRRKRNLRGNSKNVHRAFKSNRLKEENNVLVANESNITGRSGGNGKEGQRPTENQQQEMTKDGQEQSTGEINGLKEGRSENTRKKESHSVPITASVNCDEMLKEDANSADRPSEDATAKKLSEKPIYIVAETPLLPNPEEDSQCLLETCNPAAAKQISKPTTKKKTSPFGNVNFNVKQDESKPPNCFDFVDDYDGDNDLYGRVKRRSRKSKMDEKKKKDIPDKNEFKTRNTRVGSRRTAKSATENVVSDKYRNDSREKVAKTSTDNEMRFSTKECDAGKSQVVGKDVIDGSEVNPRPKTIIHKDVVGTDAATRKQSTGLENVDLLCQAEDHILEDKIQQNVNVCSPVIEHKKAESLPVAEPSLLSDSREDNSVVIPPSIPSTNGSATNVINPMAANISMVECPESRCRGRSSPTTCVPRSEDYNSLVDEAYPLQADPVLPNSLGPDAANRSEGYAGTNDICKGEIIEQQTCEESGNNIKIKSSSVLPVSEVELFSEKTDFYQSIENIERAVSQSQSSSQSVDLFGQEGIEENDSHKASQNHEIGAARDGSLSQNSTSLLENNVAAKDSTMSLIESKTEEQKNILMQSLPKNTKEMETYARNEIHNQFEEHIKPIVNMEIEVDGKSIEKHLPVLSPKCLLAENKTAFENDEVTPCLASLLPSTNASQDTPSCSKTSLKQRPFDNREGTPTLTLDSQQQQLSQETTRHDPKLSNKQPTDNEDITQIFNSDSKQKNQSQSSDSGSPKQQPFVNKIVSQTCTSISQQQKLGQETASFDDKFSKQQPFDNKDVIKICTSNSEQRKLGQTAEVSAKAETQHIFANTAFKSSDNRVEHMANKDAFQICAACQRKLQQKPLEVRKLVESVVRSVLSSEYNIPSPVSVMKRFSTGSLKNVSANKLEKRQVRSFGGGEVGKTTSIADSTARELTQNSFPIKIKRLNNVSAEDGINLILKEADDSEPGCDELSDHSRSFPKEERKSTLRRKSETDHSSQSKKGIDNNLGNMKVRSRISKRKVNEDDGDDASSTLQKRRLRYRQAKKDKGLCKAGENGTNHSRYSAGIIDMPEEDATDTILSAQANEDASRTQDVIPATPPSEMAVEPRFSKISQFHDITPSVSETYGKESFESFSEKQLFTSGHSTDTEIQEIRKLRARVDRRKRHYKESVNENDCTKQYNMQEVLDVNSPLVDEENLVDSESGVLHKRDTGCENRIELNGSSKIHRMTLSSEAKMRNAFDKKDCEIRIFDNQDADCFSFNDDTQKMRNNYCDLTVPETEKLQLRRKSEQFFDIEDKITKQARQKARSLCLDISQKRKTDVKSSKSSSIKTQKNILETLNNGDKKLNNANKSFEIIERRIDLSTQSSDEEDIDGVQRCEKLLVKGQSETEDEDKDVTMNDEKYRKNNEDEENINDVVKSGARNETLAKEQKQLKNEQICTTVSDEKAHQRSLGIQLDIDKGPLMEVKRPEVIMSEFQNDENKAMPINTRLKSTEEYPQDVMNEEGIIEDIDDEKDLFASAEDILEVCETQPDDVNQENDLASNHSELPLGLESVPSCKKMADSAAMEQDDDNGSYFESNKEESFGGFLEPATNVNMTDDARNAEKIGPTCDYNDKCDKEEIILKEGIDENADKDEQYSPPSPTPPPKLKRRRTSPPKIDVAVAEMKKLLGNNKEINEELVSHEDQTETTTKKQKTDVATADVNNESSYWSKCQVRQPSQTRPEKKQGDPNGWRNSLQGKTVSQISYNSSADNDILAVSSTPQPTENCLAKKKHPVIEKEILKTPIINSRNQNKENIIQHTSVKHGLNTPEQSKHERTFTIVPSRLTRKEMAYCKALAEKMGCKFSSVFVPESTHLVMTTDENFAIDRSAYTYKYLMALITGTWIVGFRWIVACLKAGKLITEDSFEVKGDISFHQQLIPMKYRVAKANKATPLFHRLTLSMMGDFKSGQMNKEQLVQILQICGAEVILTIPKETPVKNYLVITDNESLTNDLIDQCLKSNVQPVHYDWITESIINYKVQDPTKFVFSL